MPQHAPRDDPPEEVARLVFDLRVLLERLDAGGHAIAACHLSMAINQLPGAAASWSEEPFDEPGGIVG